MTPLASERSRPARFVAALLASVMAACGSSGAPETAATHDPPVAVTVVEAALATSPEVFDAGGAVEARATAVVSSRVVAPVVELRVRAGDRVRAGQVLVVLDDAALGAQARQAAASVAAGEQALSAARTEHAAAVADQKLADAWHARITALHERHAATPQELDQAEAGRAGAAARVEGALARIDAAAAQVTAAQASADAARTTQGYAAITAPFDGLVTETMTDQGNLASPGVPLLRVDAAGAPRVEVRVDEARAAFVRPGDGVQVVLGAADAAYVEGVVTEVARAVATDERAFTVKVSLPESQALRTGTFARVRFDGPVRERLLVPAGAIRKQGQVATIFVVEDAIARLRLLQTGIVAGDRVEVLAGLEAGEIVVADAPPSLADGDRVDTSGRGDR